MNRPLKSLALVIFAAWGALSQAGYYKLYGRANEQIFFGPSSDYSFEQTNGAKFWSMQAMGQTVDDYAVSNTDVRFGKHSGSCLVKGLFSNAYSESRTEEDLTFTSKTGLPMLVQFNLVGGAAVNHPGQTSYQGARSSLTINGEVRVGYEDSYIGDIHKLIVPQPYVVQVNSGTTLRVYQRTIFQITGPFTADLYFVVCHGGIQTEVKVMSPGGKMTSSSGARYVPVLALGPKP